MRKASSNRVEMAGKTYNSWKVIEPDLEKSNGKSLYWFAECLECSQVYTVFGANIRNGQSKRCSKCGCKNGHGLQKGQVRTSRTPEETALKYLYNNLKKNAKRYGRIIEWSLTIEQVKKLVFDNCFYCNIEPNNVCTPLKNHGLSQKNEESATITRHGIDRIDSTKGYIAGNVVTCCTHCNTMKMDYSLDSFTSQMRKILANLDNKK